MGAVRTVSPLQSRAHPTKLRDGVARLRGLRGLLVAYPEPKQSKAKSLRFLRVAGSGLVLHEVATAQGSHSHMAVFRTCLVSCRAPQNFRS